MSRGRQAFPLPLFLTGSRNADSAEQRQDYLSALEAGLDVLEATMHQCQLVPKEQVPPVTTPAYLAFCQSLWLGDYPAARQHAARKLRDLAS